MVTKAPNIVELDLANWPGYELFDFRALKSLEILDLGVGDASEFPLLPPSIRNLSVASSLRSEDSAYSHLPNIESLTLYTGFLYKAIGLPSLLGPSKGKLKKLHLTAKFFGEPAYGPGIFQRLIDDGLLSETTVLSAINTGLNDEVVGLIANNLPKLRILSLEGSSITGVGVKVLVLKPGDKLEMLDVRKCDRLSHDAIEWARSKGVQVLSGSSGNVRYLKKLL